MKARKWWFQLKDAIESCLSFVTILLILLLDIPGVARYL